MIWIKKHWGFAAVIITMLFIYSLLPLGAALQFGEDEGYELVTGFLMSKGYALYTQIWYDQPPLLVLLLDCVFKHWGPSLMAARLVAAGFGLILFGTFFQIVSQRIGRRAAFLATFFLLSSPAILELSVSVMQEVPAYGLALISTLLLFQWAKTPRVGWLVASGAVLGLSLEIKYTTALVAPAILVEIWLQFNRKHGLALLKPSLIAFLQWGMATGLTLAILTVFWGQDSFRSSYRSHFVEHAVFGLPRPEDFPMPWGIFQNHAEVVIAAVIGLLLVAQRHQWREFAFPAVMLATAMTVHTFHRPWWMYYYLHIAIPMSWLAGFTMESAITRISHTLSKHKFKLSSQKTLEAIGLCALVAIVLVRSENRLEGAVAHLRDEERAGISPVLGKIREYASRTNWIYVEYTKDIFSFQAQLPMPPELAVVTLKRFWSDQISNDTIIKICQQYKPEQLLLDPLQATHSWQAFLQDYTIVYEDQTANLYVLKSILPKPIETDVVKPVFP